MRVPSSFRNRTSRSSTAQTTRGEEILHQIFPTRHPAVDEECKGSKESYFLGRGSILFVGTCLLLYARQLDVVSDGHDRSIFVVQVYRKHRVGKDKLVASLSGTIGDVLQKLKDGGTKILQMTCQCSTDLVQSKYFKRVLPKITPMGLSLRSSSRWPLGHMGPSMQANIKPQTPSLGRPKRLTHSAPRPQSSAF